VTQIVDHKLQVQLSEEGNVNVLTTLSVLRSGLKDLNDRTLATEIVIGRYESENKKKITFFGFGLEPFFDDEDASVIYCNFHWFGVMACNYARLVGYIHAKEELSSFSFTNAKSRNKRMKEECTKYVKSIAELEPLLFWRHKVFAHFAITDPWEEDSEAFLEASLMSSIGYWERRLRLGGLNMIMLGGEVELPTWSLTETYDKLSLRFWP
jgi:hypothetical protein